VWDISKNGILQAYAIAFIGYDEETKQEIIYISDLASYKHESKAGGAVIKALFERIHQTHKEIKEQYGLDLPVFMQTTMDDQGVIVFLCRWPEIAIIFWLKSNADWLRRDLR